MTQANFSVDSISEFLTIADTDYRIFDLGRVVREVPRELFRAIELGQQPYPTPLQRHAWLAIVFWQRHNNMPFIWFSKFPLDERGLLNHAARQHFLQIIVEALGRDLTAEATPEQAELLKQNPYVFTPDETKRAAFHAHVSVLLNHPPSVYFEDVESFITKPVASSPRVNDSEVSTQSVTQDWQTLGVQGLHDVAARLSSLPRVTTALSEQFLKWPAAFQRQLAAALEHQVLPHHLVQNIVVLLQRDCGPHSLKTQQRLFLIRSLGATLYDLWVNQRHLKSLQNLRQYLQQFFDPQVLGDAQLATQDEADLLVIIAARCWPLLLDQGFRQDFLDRLSVHQDLFNHVFADLVGLPELRIHLLMMMRDRQQQSAELAAALSRLQQQLQPTAK